MSSTPSPRKIGVGRAARALAHGLLLTGLLGPAAETILAEEEAASTTLAAPTPAPAPGSAATRPRFTSPGTAAKIATRMPQYVAPNPAAGPAPDLRESDRPKNTIIRLPDYIVRSENRSLPNAREVLTEQGRLDLAMKRLRGLRIDRVTGRNNRIALAMQAEADRLEDMAYFNELLDLVATDDPAKAKQLRAQWQQTYLRSDEWVSKRLVNMPLRIP